jgi:hypothetical protein
MGSRHANDPRETNPLDGDSQPVRTGPTSDARTRLLSRVTRRNAIG